VSVEAIERQGRAGIAIARLNWPARPRHLWQERDHTVAYPLRPSDLG
jgi:hypothetical protein